MGQFFLNPPVPQLLPHIGHFFPKSLCTTTFTPCRSMYPKSPCTTTFTLCRSMYPKSPCTTTFTPCRSMYPKSPCTTTFTPCRSNYPELPCTNTFTPCRSINSKFPCTALTPHVSQSYIPRFHRHNPLCRSAVAGPAYSLVIPAALTLCCNCKLLKQCKGKFSSLKVNFQAS